MIDINTLIDKFPDCLESYNELLKTRKENSSHGQVVDWQVKESNDHHSKMKFSDWEAIWGKTRFAIDTEELMTNYGFNFFEAMDGCEYVWHYTTILDMGHRKTHCAWAKGSKVKLLAMWGLNFEYFKNGNWGHEEQSYFLEMPLEHFTILSEVLKKRQGSGNYWRETEELKSLLKTGDFLLDENF